MVWSLVVREAAAEPSTDSVIWASENYAKGLDRLDGTSSHRGRYQTLGCIDPPEKGGQRASYGYRHLVQALLVRRLLWERVPAGQIAALMAGRSTAEAEQMFIGGVLMVARAEGGEGASGRVSPAREAAEMWRRIRVAAGVELHLRAGLPGLKPGELERLRSLLEAALERGR